MASVTFDRFDGGLLLARPSSVSPANSLSRALNVDVQPGGWIRSRPIWSRTASATLINNQFKGLDSNSGHLWTFGAGDAAQVTAVTINSSQATGLNSIFYAFHSTGTVNPVNVQLLGTTKWLNGFAAVFNGVNSIASLFYRYSTPPLSKPANVVFFDGLYFTHSSSSSAIYSSTDGLNFSIAATPDKQMRVASMNTYRETDGTERLFIELYTTTNTNNRHFLIASSSSNLVPSPPFNYSTSGLTYTHAMKTVAGASIITTTSGIYRNGSLVTTGYFLAAIEKAGVIVAVGTGGAIKTSADDGLTWTSRTSGVTHDIYRMIVHNGLFVAGGRLGGALITSPDGVTWTSRTPTGINALASSGEIIWAGGQDGAAWKSEDAITWTAQNTTQTTTDYYGAAYGPSGFCAAGYAPSGGDGIVLADYNGFLKVLYQRSGTAAVSSTQITDANMPNSGLLLTLGSRIYSISEDGQSVRFSCVGSASIWTDAGPNVGSGFLPISQHFGSGQRAYALGAYQGKLAVFSDTSIQIWRVDPDPTAIALENVIEGVGTRHHSSIVSLQGDLLFLSDSGVRSLTTLQNSLYPSDTDVGLPIKKITPSPSQIARIARFGQAPACIGLAAIPFAQYWVAAPDLWDVDPSSSVQYGWASWSFSRQAKLNAWSAHGSSFKISAWTTLGSTLYARSDGDDYLMQMQPDAFGVEQVGGEEAPYSCEFDTQWLDLKKPGVRKVLTGIDFDGQNVASVQVYASVAGNREGVLMDTLDVNSNQAGWTYSGEIIPVQADATEFKLRFVGVSGSDVQVNRLTLYFDEVGLA